MSEPVSAPRFPFVAAALCAACVGAAAWSWMRYSYAWDVTPGDIADLVPDGERWKMLVCPAEDSKYYSRYVALRGRVRNGSRPRTVNRLCYVVLGGGHDAPESVGVFVPKKVRLDCGDRFEVKGRVLTLPEVPEEVYVFATASRFHPASITGLIVGAMGVFVFAVYLRHWLRERGGQRA